MHLTLLHRCSPADKWETRTAAEVHEMFGENIYDAADLRTRKQIVDIDAHPLLDANNREIPLFTESGDRFLRRTALTPADGIKYCGLLCDINKARTLY